MKIGDTINLPEGQAILRRLWDRDGRYESWEIQFVHDDGTLGHVIDKWIKVLSD